MLYKSFDWYSFKFFRKKKKTVVSSYTKLVLPLKSSKLDNLPHNYSKPVFRRKMAFVQKVLSLNSKEQSVHLSTLCFIYIEKLHIVPSF